MFLFSIFCQWFSRGCLLKSCLEQQHWQTLLIAFAIGTIIGSPVQGYMSDRGSRKTILIITILCVILSMMIVFIGKPLCSMERFPYLLAIASIINGVFGNVFPVAAAAYSEQIKDPRKSLTHSLPCRYGSLMLPFLLKLPHFTTFLIAMILNQISLIWVAYNFKDKAPLNE